MAVFWHKKALKPTTVTTNEKDGVEVGCFALKAVELLCILPEPFLGLQKFLAFRVALKGLDGTRIQGSFAASWGCNSDIAVRRQLVVWMGEFREIPRPSAYHPHETVRYASQCKGTIQLVYLEHRFCCGM